METITTKDGYQSLTISRGDDTTENTLLLSGTNPLPYVIPFGSKVDVILKGKDSKGIKVPTHQTDYNAIEFRVLKEQFDNLNSKTSLEVRVNHLDGTVSVLPPEKTFDIIIDS